MPRARGIPTSSPPRPPRAHFIIPARKPGTAEQRGLGPGLPDAAEPPGPCSSGASCSIRLLPVLCLTFPAHQGGVLPGQALRNIFALLSYQMESQDQLETAQLRQARGGGAPRGRGHTRADLPVKETPTLMQGRWPAIDKERPGRLAAGLPPAQEACLGARPEQGNVMRIHHYGKEEGAGEA